MSQIPPQAEVQQQERNHDKARLTIAVQEMRHLAFSQQFQNESHQK